MNYEVIRCGTKAEMKSSENKDLIEDFEIKNLEIKDDETIYKIKDQSGVNYLFVGNFKILNIGPQNRISIQPESGTLLFKNPETDIKNFKTYKGDFANGLPHGKGVFEVKSTNGEILVLYSGEFKNCLPEGDGCLVVAEKYNYDGEFKKGMPHGRGVLQYHSGKLIIGSFVDGKIHGDALLVGGDASSTTNVNYNLGKITRYCDFSEEEKTSDKEVAKEQEPEFCFPDVSNNYSFEDELRKLEHPTLPSPHGEFSSQSSNASLSDLLGFLDSPDDSKIAQNSPKPKANPSSQPRDPCAISTLVNISDRQAR